MRTSNNYKAKNIALNCKNHTMIKSKLTRKTKLQTLKQLLQILKHGH